MAQFSSTRDISFPDGGLHLGEGTTIGTGAWMKGELVHFSYPDTYTIIYRFWRYLRNIYAPDIS